MNLNKAATSCFLAAFAIAAILTVGFWGEWIAVVMVWVFAIPLAFAIAQVLGFTAAMFGITLEDDDEEFDDAYDFVETDMDGIVYSDEIVGKYMDADIHSYVEIDMPNGKKIKCVYETVIDMNGPFDPPEDKLYILLEPGILYIAEPENTAQTQTAAA